MSNILTNNKNYYDIANTIRQMKNVNTTYKPSQMSSALKDIYSNEAVGTLPLSVVSNGMSLINYRIDGASGGVGDRTINLLSSELVDGYHLNATTGLPQAVANRCATITPTLLNNINSLVLSFETSKTNIRAIYSTFLNDTLVEQAANIASGTTINASNANKIFIAFYATNNSAVTTDDISNVMISETSSNYEPYGYKIPVTIQGKNQLQNTASTNTVAGVTFTVNDDKSITCNGTATAVTTFAIKTNCNFAGMILTGCPAGGGANTYMIRERSGQSTSNDTGSGATLKYSNSQIEIRIASGYTCNNLTFYPMVRFASIEDDTYEPYHEPNTTTIYLDEPIYENESISSLDTGVNIPTIDGTNIITVDTTVQPSNVYIQAPKDSLEAIQIANRLEEI